MKYKILATVLFAAVSLKSANAQLIGSYTPDFYLDPSKPSGGPMPAPTYPPGGGIPGSSGVKPGPKSPKPYASPTPGDFNAAMDKWERSLVARDAAWLKARLKDPRFAKAKDDIQAEYQRRIDFIAQLKKWYIENYDPSAGDVADLKKQVDKVWNEEEKPRRKQANREINSICGITPGAPSGTVAAAGSVDDIDPAVTPEAGTRPVKPVRPRTTYNDLE